MRIGIEAQRIFRPKKHGMDMVAIELIRNLQQIDTQNEYFIFVRPDTDNQVITETPNFKIVEIPGSFYPLWEQVLLPLAAQKYQCEVLHCTSNTAPLFTGIPLVNTLHDIIFMESSIMQLIFGKGTSYQRFGNVYRHLIIPPLMKKARKVITVSEYENKRISDFFKLKNHKLVATVYNGVSEHFNPVTDPEILQRVKTKYKLPNRFLFFLGNTHPKKNTEGVLIAFSKFLQHHSTDIKLVLIDYNLNTLSSQLISLGIPEIMKNIVVAGYVNNKDLPAIYSQCELFLYPSLRESFGIPIIEAMACGAPVITSNTSSMPEVAGNAALLVNPFNTDEIYEAMLAVINNKIKTQQMVERGYKQAAKFKWSMMAEKLHEIYHQVVNNYQAQTV
jgi:glycosyltransferase involved in cell wall biosynthesis